MSGSFSMFYQNQQSQLGYLYLDVLATENLVLPSDVTKYPIEDGSEDISDHITRNNEELTITGAISGSSSFGFEFGASCYSKMIDAIDQLRAMHKERKPITIYTGLGKYEDMAFTNLSINRQSGADRGGNWLDINASLRKIKKVALKEANLPPDKTSDHKSGTTERRASKSGEHSEPPDESLALKGARAADTKFGTHIVGPK